MFYFGLAIGLSVYLLIFSKAFIKINVKLILFLKKIILYPLKLILKLIKKLFLKPISFIFINIRKNMTNTFTKLSKIHLKFPKKTKKLPEKEGI